MGKASQPKRVVVQKGGNTEGVHQIKAFATTALGQVIIISYDLFRMNAPLFQQCRSALLIMDEAHRLKNTAGSLTLTALESLPCDARLCITATPVQNATQDLFSICNFVNPGLLGDLTTFRKGWFFSSIYRFWLDMVLLCDTHFQRISHSNHDLSLLCLYFLEYERPIAASNNKSCSSEQRRRGMAQSRILEEITKTFMLRRLQKDVLKTMLPPRTEVLLFCRPTAKQCKLYKEFTRRPSADPLSTLTRLRKLCSHPAMAVEDTTTTTSSSSSTTVLDPSLDATNVEFSGKVSFLDSLLANIRVEAIQDKIVIVSNFTSTLTMIENSILKPRGLTFIRLDGTTELSNRQGTLE